MSGHEFSDDVEYVAEAPQLGRVQFFHHKKSCDPTGKKLLGDIYGWCIQAGRWDYLDKACAKAELKQYHVKQKDKINTYWQLGSSSENQSEWGSARFFILAKGMLSVEQMGMNGGKRGFNGIRAGIAAGWIPQKKGRDKPQKALKARVFPEELLANGLERPVILAVSGQSKVDDLIAALGKDGHGRVIRANNARLEARGAKPITPYAGFFLALMVGDQAEQQQQDGDQGSPVTKIITDIPDVIDDTFLDEHHAGIWWPIIWEDLKKNKYSEEWSKEASAAIYSGDTEELESPAAPVEESFDHPFDDSPSVGPDGDYSSMPAEYRDPGQGQGKPAAKPQPSNDTQKLPDAELAKIPGTAKLPQRRFIQERLRRPDLARTPGLSEESAKKYIIELQRTQR